MSRYRVDTLYRLFFFILKVERVIVMRTKTANLWKWKLSLILSLTSIRKWKHLWLQKWKHSFIYKASQRVKNSIKKFHKKCWQISRCVILCICHREWHLMLCKTYEKINKSFFIERSKYEKSHSWKKIAGFAKIK